MIKTSATQRIREIIPAFVGRFCRFMVRVVDPYASFSYSQEGEDMILLRLFGRTSRGFYVDVGAHHPYRFSNTCALHMRAWHGINIDADPDAVEAFRRHRPLDINLALGVSDVAGNFTLYRFSDPALNTIDPELARQRAAIPDYRVDSQREIRVERLDSILGQYIPAGQTIDLLNVDVEGRDLQVLRSNDWDRYRPQCIVVEARVRGIEDLASDPVNALLVDKGYRFFAKTVNTLIYVHRDGGFGESRADRAVRL